MSRPLARVKVNFATLALALELPSSLQILDVGASIMYADAVELKITGPGLPEVGEGAVIPVVPLETVQALGENDREGRWHGNE